MKLTMFWSVALVVTSILVPGQAADSALYTCATDGSLKVTGIVVDSFTPEVAVAAGKSFADCSSDTTQATRTTIITGTGASGDPFKVDIPIATTSCDHTAPTGAATVHTYRILVLEVKDITKSTDKLFTFTCDTADANSVVTKSAAITAATTLPVSTAATKDIPSVLNLVLDTDTATAVTSANLGEAVRLKYRLTDTNKPVKKCKVLDCYAAKDAALTAKKQIIDANGCTVTTGYKLFPAATNKFDALATDTTNNLRDHLLDTTFKLFKFTGAASLNEVYFECKCSGCLTAGDTACDATCTGGGRKKRDAQPSNRTETSAITRITITSGDIQTREKQEAAFVNCLNHVSFIAVVAILALLLLISLAVSVFFCSKLLRQKEQSRSMEAYPNPGYKA